MDSVGLSPKPGSDPFNKRVFMRVQIRPAGPHGPRPAHATSRPNQKKKFLPEAVRSTHGPRSETQKINPQEAKIMFINLDQKPKNKNPKVMFKPRSKTQK